MRAIMKIVAAPIVLCAATSAHATSGLTCDTAGPHPISVQMVIGETAVSSIVQARLTIDGKNLPVIVAQSWLEPSEVRLDLVDPGAGRHELRLRAKANGLFYDGSIWRGGQRRWIRCRES